MNKREIIFQVLTDARVLVLIGGTAFLWRAVISTDEKISLGESVCSGLSLFIIGWGIFAYLCFISLKPTNWPVTSRIYRAIAFSLLVLNIYVAIYYGIRWYGLLHIEISALQDYIYQDLRYVIFMVYYCLAIGSARYLKGMYENYRLLIKERPKKKRAKNKKEAIFHVMTHERTLVVVIAAAILWRVFIGSDNFVTFWESTCSGILLIAWGWSLFGYFCALSIKVKHKMDLTKVIQHVALGLMAINIYAVFYYGIRWYELICRIMGEVTETYAPQPLEMIFRDIRFVMLIIFYCTIVLLAKHLVHAYEDYTVPAKKG